MARFLSASTSTACALVAALILGAAPLAGAQEQTDAVPTETPLFITPPAEEDSNPLGELAALSREAGALGEELHSAQAESEAATRIADRERVAADEARARADAAARLAASSQDEVDSVAVQRYRSGGSDVRNAALLTSTPRDLLDRLEILSVLSGVNLDRLEESRVARDDAEGLARTANDAARDADEAATESAERAAELERRHEDLRVRIQVVEEAVDALDAEARAEWTGGPSSRLDVDPAQFGAGDNGPALEAAATRIGAPYSWGATGPTSFDCSGLMVWSYAQMGKSLPRSSQMQAQSGAAVSRADIQPGDLVIYFPEATHVGMYAGDGRVLHASTYGVPVGLDPVDSMPIHSIRRY